MIGRIAWIVAAAAMVASNAGAQDRSAGRPASVLEAAFGYTPFLDDAVIAHTAVGVAGRYYLWPRISIGPELTFMAGPGSDRDMMLTGNVSVDLLAARAGRPRRLTPFLLAGAGWFRHTDRFGSEAFASNEGAVTIGAGLRGWTSERVFVAVDARLGWEPHARVAATVGFALGR